MLKEFSRIWTRRPEAHFVADVHERFERGFRALLLSRGCFVGRAADLKADMDSEIHAAAWDGWATEIAQLFCTITAEECGRIMYWHTHEVSEKTLANSRAMAADLIGVDLDEFSRRVADHLPEAMLAHQYTVALWKLRRAAMF